MVDLICDKLKEIKHLENNIKLDDLEYAGKSWRNYAFSKYQLLIVL